MRSMSVAGSLGILAIAALLALLPASAQDSPPVRVRGTIERVDGSNMVVKVRDGSELKITLADPGQQIRVLLNQHEARYYWDRGGDLVAIDPHEPQVERAVYLILAELAKEAVIC